METLFIKDSLGNDVEVIMEVTTYQNNNQIAILLYEKETGEYYSDLSVFVEPFDNKCYMAVDVNNLPNAEEFIERYELGELVDYVHSGFVSYPVYDMAVVRLADFDSKGAVDFVETNGDGVLMESGIAERTVRDRLK